MRATIDWFEAKGKERLTAEVHSDDWYGDFIEFLARERAFATLLTPARDARRRPRQALGHRPQRGLQRDPRLLRASVLVRVAGHDPRPRPDLAERQRRRPPPRRRAARGRRDLRLRPLRARPRRGHLLDRHGPHSRRRGRLPRERRQVLHRQRQPGRDGLGVRATSRRRGSRRLRLLRRRQLPPGLQADLERRARADVRQRLRARRLPGPGRGRPPHRRRGVRGGAEHDQRRQVQPRLLRDRDVGALLLRDRDPGREPGPVRQAGDRVRPGAADPHRGLRTAGRGEALRRARRRLRAQREPRRPPLSALHADQQDAGHHRGRADRAPAGRGDLGEGLRARQLFRERQEHHRRAAEARGHRPRQPRADPQVPAQLPVRDRGARGAAGRGAIPTTTHSSSPRARPAGSARSPFRIGARSSTASRSFPTWPAFASRPSCWSR